MLITVAQALAGLALLYLGGELLVRGAAALAARIGITPLAIGLTVVALGTSLPELVVSVDAALAGANDISIGNVVGSNIANIALILGVAALLRPVVVEAKVVRIDAPLMVLASLALVGVLMRHQDVSRAEGSFLVVCLSLYVGLTLRSARREPREIREEFASAAPEVRAGAWVSGFLVLAGLALLVFGGHFLVTSAVQLATALGISQSAIGLTVVAVGTSLPELSTSVIASFRGQGDIAVGNVVGSNIFNILGILGTTAVIRPLQLGGITWIDLGAMVALATVLMLLLLVRPRLGRVVGALSLASYVVYTVWLLTA